MADTPEQDEPTGLRIVFDGPPGPQSGRFVEVETPDGKSVNAGEWHERDDGLWELRLGPRFTPSLPLATEARKALRDHQEQCDEHGEFVKVSRQALDETLDAIDAALGVVTPGPVHDNDAENLAWTWLESKWLNIEAGHDPNDRDYSADEMVDAFMAGRESRLSPTIADGVLREAAYHCEQARTYISQPAASTRETHMVTARYHLDKARALLRGQSVEEEDSDATR